MSKNLDKSHPNIDSSPANSPEASSLHGQMVNVDDFPVLLISTVVRGHKASLSRIRIVAKKKLEKLAPAQQENDSFKCALLSSSMMDRQLRRYTSIVDSSIDYSVHSTCSRMPLVNCSQNCWFFQHSYTLRSSHLANQDLPSAQAFLCAPWGVLAA